MNDLEFLKMLFGVTEGSPWEGKRVRYIGAPDSDVQTGDLGTVQFQDGDGDLCVVMDGSEEGEAPLGFLTSEVELLDE